MYNTGIIIAIVFVVILVSIVLIEIYVPSVSTAINIGLKASATATIVSIIIFSVIIIYKMSYINLFNNEELINALGDAVSVGIKKAANDTTDNAIQSV
jgi:uncharacterized membrane protein